MEPPVSRRLRERVLLIVYRLADGAVSNRPLVKDVAREANVDEEACERVLRHLESRRFVITSCDFVGRNVRLEVTGIDEAERLATLDG